MSHCAHCGQCASTRNLFHIGRRITACTICLPPGHVSPETTDLCGLAKNHATIIAGIKTCLLVQYTEIPINRESGTRFPRASCTTSDFFAVDVPQEIDTTGMSVVEIITLANTTSDFFAAYHPIQQYAIHRVLQFLNLAEPDREQHSPLSGILYYQLESKTRAGVSLGVKRQTLVLPSHVRILSHILIDRIC